MLAVVCGIVGVAVGIIGINLLEKNPAPGIGALVVAGVLVFAAFRGDPIGAIAKNLRDNNDFSSTGYPNYWYNLNTGEKYHIEDKEVAACRTIKQTATVNGVEIETCSLFGGGPSLLYAGWGPVKQIADTMRLGKSRSGTKFDIIWPGDVVYFDAQRNGGIWAMRTNLRCYDFFAADINGRPIGNTGLEYRHLANGQWSGWYTRPENLAEKSTVRVVSRVEIRTPDDLPRPLSGSFQPSSIALNGESTRGYQLYCIQ